SRPSAARPSRRPATSSQRCPIRRSWTSTRKTCFDGRRTHRRMNDRAKNLLTLGVSILLSFLAIEAASRILVGRQTQVSRGNASGAQVPRDELWKTPLHILGEPRRLRTERGGVGSGRRRLLRGDQRQHLQLVSMARRSADRRVLRRQVAPLVGLPRSLPLSRGRQSAPVL